MTDEQIFLLQINKTQASHEQNIAIKSEMSKFLAYQAKVFNQPFAEAEAILNDFCGTMEKVTVTDPELRFALEFAVNNL
ncbi:hypothetical protein GcM1_175006 [Golovinomyces cichoracearum]|uniref:Uncharacterized protein n=1 Tax=Golovinomyces cichoracearum TaxID=62708 RepID=A0A420J5F9_9PEZI|nr:hypothetical protein GcM1_175006 [Golovinomyces cichoracearum]